MHKKIYIPVIDTKCPENMTKATCDLDKYIREEYEKKQNKLFHLTTNEDVLHLNKSYNEYSEEYEAEIAKWIMICDKCKNKCISR